MSFEGAFEEYIAAFAGVGLLALLVSHPTFAPNLIGAAAALVTRVTNIGQGAANRYPGSAGPMGPQGP